MARTTAPLFSMDASGSVAGAIVFSRWRGRNYVRRHAIPSNPRTGLQVGVRSVFRFITQDWKVKDPSFQALWEAVGNVTRVTGLNADVAENVRRIRQGRPPQNDPTDESTVACDPVQGFSATPLARAVALDWTYLAPGAGIWGTLLYMAIGAPVVPSIANLIAVTPGSALQAVITGLTPSLVYYFEITTFSFFNNINGSPAQASATPTA